MAYLLTPSGAEKIKGRYSKILFKGELLTSGQLAKKIGLSGPCVSARMSKYIKGINRYDDVVNPNNCISLSVVIDGVSVTSTELMDETGYSRSYITRQIHKFNDGEITENELRMPIGDTIKPAVIVVAPPRKVDPVKPKQTNEERNEEYKRQLIMYKSYSRSTVGSY